MAKTVKGQPMRSCPKKPKPATGKKKTGGVLFSNN